MPQNVDEREAADHYRTIDWQTGDPPEPGWYLAVSRRIAPSSLRLIEVTRWDGMSWWRPYYTVTHWAQLPKLPPDSP